jgi:hypothetical protein
VATTELSCARHHTPTQLTCAQCGKPSCTKCLVWTEVGQKCRTCVYPKGDPSRARLSPPALLALVAAGLVVALVGGLAFLGREDSPELPRVANAGTQRPGLGEAARDGPLTFVVNKIDCERKVLGEGGGARTALGRFCILDFKATNTGTQPAFFNVPTQLLLDGQRRRFAPDLSATSMLLRSTGSAAGLGPSQQMNPGAEISTQLVYDIPESVTPQMAELHGTGPGLGVTVRLTDST